MNGPCSSDGSSFPLPGEMSSSQTADWGSPPSEVDLDMDSYGLGDIDGLDHQDWGIHDVPMDDAKLDFSHPGTLQQTGGGGSPTEFYQSSSDSASVSPKASPADDPSHSTWDRGQAATEQDDNAAIPWDADHTLGGLFGVGGGNKDPCLATALNFDIPDSPIDDGLSRTMAMPSPSMPAMEFATGQTSGRVAGFEADGHSRNFSQASLTQGLDALRTSGSSATSPQSPFLASPSVPSPDLHTTPFSQIPVRGTRSSLLNRKKGSAASAPPAKTTDGPLSRKNLLQGPRRRSHVTTSPPQDSLGRFALYIRLESPKTGHELFPDEERPYKSRVETQISIKIVMPELPPGVKKLHLPSHTISKPKLLAKPQHQSSPDTLELFTSLVCTTAMNDPRKRDEALRRAALSGHPPVEGPPAKEDLEKDDPLLPANGGEVGICGGCISRERKRAGRKKNKKVEEEERWAMDERRRVIVFNTQEVKEWIRDEPPEAGWLVETPMRIACYCRHTDEKVGFQVIFTLKDHQGQVVAQAMSMLLNITDDHKTGSQGRSHRTSASPEQSGTHQHIGSGAKHDKTPPQVSGNPMRMSQSSSNLQCLQGNFQGSLPMAAMDRMAFSGMVDHGSATGLRPLTDSMGPAVKKRKAGPNRGLAMTKLETSPAIPSRPDGFFSASQSAATSPFSIAPSGLPPAPTAFGNGMAPTSTLAHAYASNPSTPNMEDSGVFPQFSTPIISDHRRMTPMYSAPSSAYNSRAPSPGDLTNGLHGLPHQATHSLPLSTGPLMLPTAFKVTPNRGPARGGTETVILGSHFYQGLEVQFGGEPGVKAIFFSPTALVCNAPPSPTARTVNVTLRDPLHPIGPPQQAPLLTYTYVDDAEEALLREFVRMMSASQGDGNGDIDAVIRQLMNNQRGGGSGASGGSMPSSGQTFRTNSCNIEGQLIKCLEYTDLDDSPYGVRLNHKSKDTGHTLLHLASSLGFDRLVAGLLARGADPDARDRGGFTPLHFAAMNKHLKVVHRLVRRRADPTIKSFTGRMAADVAGSRDILLELQRVAKHARSRSVGSLLGIHGSTSSLQAMRDLYRKSGAEDLVATRYESEESLEYSSFGDETSEEEEHDAFIHMRRPSKHMVRRDDTSHELGMKQFRLGDDTGSPSASTTAVAAWKEQVALQWQAMVGHFPSLAQWPYLPQMTAFPPWAVLTDSQGYAYSPAFVRRLAEYVPGMSWPRSDAAETEEAGRSWDRSWLMGGAPPPAYDDIYPGGDPDAKPRSAEEAAIRLRNIKNSMQLTACDDAPSPSMAPQTIRTGVLQIGRKNGLTKEQQDEFLRAREEKFKRLSRDKNLFVIWIPLLVFMLLALICSRIPGVLDALWERGAGVIKTGATFTATLMDRGVRA